MGNNIFEAGLLYPGKPGSAPAKPAPPPAPVKSEPSYSAPAPAPAAPVQSSYGQPQATYNEDTYSAPASPPAPQPVYNPQPTTTQVRKFHKKQVSLWL